MRARSAACQPEMNSLSLHHLPVPQMEPVAQLAPYLDNIDVESFGRLADRLLSSSPASSSDSAESADYATSPCTSHSHSRGSWSSGGSSAGWSPASVASSYGSHERAHSVRRRRCNAHAAERYRHGQKRREFGLAEEVEREERRNAELRRQLAAKLALYNELAAILAENTGHDDLELAAVGSSSVASVLGLLDRCPADAQLEAELAHKLTKFRLILTRQPATCHLPPPSVWANTWGRQINNNN